MKSLSTSTSSSAEKNLCCVCRDDERRAFFGRREGHDLWKCRRCGLVYLSPLPELGSDFIEAAHGSSQDQKVEFWSFPEYYAKYRDVFRGFFAKRLSRIREFDPGAGEWLDVGSGFGLWMDYLREQGIAVKGLEPSPEAFAHSRELGLSVERCRFEEFESSKRFSVLVACDVLEHFERPDLALDRCRELLEPGGLLYLQVPNVLGFRIPGGHGLGLPYHFWQFNPGSLARLLRARGLEPLRYWTGVQGVIGAYESGGPTLLTKAKWQLARAMRVGNRLQMIARRIDA